MSHVAYGKRNTLGIKKRFLIFSLFILLRKSYRIIKRILLYKKPCIKKILVYPIITDKLHLSDLANRVAWGIPDTGNNPTIFFPVDDKLLDTDFTKLDIPPYQRNYLRKNHSNFKTVSKGSIHKKRFDSYFLYNKKRIFELILQGELDKIEIVDPTFFSTCECNIWEKYYFEVVTDPQKEALKKQSSRNYRSFYIKYKDVEKAYCFVSGPSFDQYKNIEIEEKSCKIICNSIVKNDNFLEYIKGPDILVFADPVFHFSPSEYAAFFRDQVLKVFRNYHCYIVVPNKSVPLLLSHYSELSERLIGIETKRRSAWHLPAHDDLWVKTTSNILTLYMLPIAAAIAKKIAILGADGRQKNEKYFWKHSSSVQFEDLMETAFKSHPSFFRDREYDKYYEKHCRQMEDLISYGEKKGKQFYSLMPSFISALNKRLLK